MPARLLGIPSTLAYMFEAALMGAALGWNATAYWFAVMTDADWAKVFGPNGVAFVAVCAVVVLWGHKLYSDNGRSKELKLAESRAEAHRAVDELNKEKRHLENRNDMHKFAEDLKGLTAESIKAQLLTNNSLAINTTKVELLVQSVNQMNALLAVSPCLVSHQLRLAALTQPAANFEKEKPHPTHESLDVHYETTKIPDNSQQ